MITAPCSTPPRKHGCKLFSKLVAILIFASAMGLNSPLESAPPTRDEVLANMQPYQGDSVHPPDHAPEVAQKVLCGYQGWFRAPGDTEGNTNLTHYGRRGRFEPGHCSIDLWPDVTELGEDERFATSFKHSDGSVAHVFSSRHRKTVLRHFQWMKDYGIDGVFVQRFAVETLQPDRLEHCNSVLANCREGANLQGRSYAVMYDLSGLRPGQTDRVIDDWKQLVDRMKIGRDHNDRAYLQHQQKPLVAVWGIGFNDRPYVHDEFETLLRFLRHDKQYGGNAVMLGVPTGWRTFDRDSVKDQKLHNLIQLADIISPWTVGRYATPEEAVAHAQRDWKPDLEWCHERKLEYMPVVFPGFSWHNMKPEFPSNQIPRLKGQFLWTQYVQAKKVGATMIYQAMFDELDEGTAIFKCTNSPPVGSSPFVTYEDLPSDYYLWLTGTGGRLLHGDIEALDQIPERR